RPRERVAGRRRVRPRDRARRGREGLRQRRHRPLYEHPPWLLRPGVPPGDIRACDAAAGGAARHGAHPGRRRREPGQHQAAERRRRDPLRRRQLDLLARGPAAGLPAAGTSARVTLARAIELARAERNSAYPKPSVGAVVVRDGEVVGEGATEPDGRHAEVVALAAAGDRARDATLYVSLEPCNHHGTTPPCADAILAAGVERVVFGAHDPNPEAAGGAERLRAAGVDVEFVDSFEARAVNEYWRTWVAKRRPFVISKAAVTLDGRVTVPGERWVTGADARRAVH